MKLLFFLGDPYVLSSEGKDKKFLSLVKVYGRRVEVLAQKVAEGKTWYMSGYLFGKRFRDKGMPHLISMTRT